MDSPREDYQQSDEKANSFFFKPQVNEESKDAETFNLTGKGEAGLKINFPFDLNKLFDMSYSFDVLKQAIEFLAGQQDGFKTDILQVKENFEKYATTDMFDEMKEKSDQNDKLHDSQFNDIWERLDQINANAKRTSTEVDNSSGRLRDQHKRIEELENQIKLLKSRGQQPSGEEGVSPGMMDALTEMIEKLRKDTDMKFEE